jgi:hypothetical protein
LTIRRLYLLLTIAVVAAAVLSLSDTALADPPVDSGNPSCFGYTQRTEHGDPGPGAGVSAFTTSATGSGEANPVNDAAQDIRPIQHVRSDVCPTESFPFPEQ